MNISSAVIEMPIEQARQKLRAYRNEKHKDAERFYRSAEAAYEQLARGRKLIRLNEAIVSGGFDEKMRPRLAIARADRREVEFWWRSYETWGRYSTKLCSDRRKVSATLTRRVEFGREPGIVKAYGDGKTWRPDVRVYAMVPAVPADVRPAVGMLADWFILWEVDFWADRPKVMRASTDPYLLQHIEGDLYAVLAEWDLTPLEKAILEHRI